MKDRNSTEEQKEILDLVAKSEQEKKQLFDERILLKMEQVLIQKGMDVRFAEYIVRGYKPTTSNEVVKAVNDFEVKFNFWIQREVNKRFNRQKY